MDASAGRFAVILCKQQPLDVARIAPILRDVLNLHRIDANRLVRRQRGILAENIAENTAERLAAALAEWRVDCEVIDSAFVEPLPRAKSAYYLDAGPQGLNIAKEKSGPIPWAHVELIAVGAIVPSAGISDNETAAFKDAGGAFSAGLAGMSDAERAAVRDAMGQKPPATSDPLVALPRWLEIVARDDFDVVAKDLPDMLLEIVVREPLRRYRVPGREMLPAPLGDDRTPNWLRNFWTMVQRIAGQLPISAVSAGTWAFLQQQSGYDLTFDLDTEFDESVRWLAFRRHQDEVKRLLTADRLGSDSDDDADIPAADGAETEAAGAGEFDVDALPEPSAEPDADVITAAEAASGAGGEPLHGADTRATTTDSDPSTSNPSTDGQPN